MRRDLDHLANQQLLSRTHGGAVPNSIVYDLPLRFKATERGASRQRIARPRWRCSGIRAAGVEVLLA